MLDYPSIITLIWYSFYAQFIIIDTLLKSYLYDTSILKEFTWIYDNKYYIIKGEIMLVTGYIWDGLILYGLYKLFKNG